MWFVFPQLDGLGSSPTAKQYTIRSPEKPARTWPILCSAPGSREYIQGLLVLEGKSASEIFGFPDDLKLRSCATLFEAFSRPGSIFQRLLESTSPDGPESGHATAPEALARWPTGT